MIILNDFITNVRDILLDNGVPFKEGFNSELREFSLSKSYFDIQYFSGKYGAFIQFYNNEEFAVFSNFSHNSLNILKHEEIPVFLEELNNKFPYSNFNREINYPEFDDPEEQNSFNSLITIINVKFIDLSEDFNPNDILEISHKIAKDTAIAEKLFLSYLES